MTGVPSRRVIAGTTLLGKIEADDRWKSLAAVGDRVDLVPAGVVKDFGCDDGNRRGPRGWLKRRLRLLLSDIW
jgi:hypothetical protein